MKLPVRLSLVSAAFCLCVCLAHAGTDGKDAKDSAPATSQDTAAPEPARFNLPGEFEVSQSYVGSADVRREGRSNSLDEYNSEARFVLTPRTPLGFLRLGANWERFSFGFSDNAPLPNTLQNINLIVGLDTKFSDSILVRFEAQPGLYGTFFDHLSSGDFNVPFVFGGTYLYSADLQIILGVGVDFNRNYPVIPGLGIRWKVAPKLVLNASFPTPRVEYDLTKNTTLYVGAELKAGNFRVGRSFGNTHNDPRLNRAVVTFSEVRVGAGLTQKITPSLTLSADGGFQPYREFDFHRADARYRSDGVAPYGQIALRGSF